MHTENENHICGNVTKSVLVRGAELGVPTVWIIIVGVLIFLNPKVGVKVVPKKEDSTWAVHV